jgi:hypothetical protein
MNHYDANNAVTELVNLLLNTDPNHKNYAFATGYLEHLLISVLTATDPEKELMTYLTELRRKANERTMSEL